MNNKLALHKGIIGKGVELTKAQIALFLNAFVETEEFLPAAGCHIPHHGLVFYGKDDKPIGYYDICFLCGNVSTSVKAFDNIDF